LSGCLCVTSLNFSADADPQSVARTSNGVSWPSIDRWTSQSTCTPSDMSA